MPAILLRILQMVAGMGASSVGMKAGAAGLKKLLASGVGQAAKAGLKGGAGSLAKKAPRLAGAATRIAGKSPPWLTRGSKDILKNVGSFAAFGAVPFGLGSDLAGNLLGLDEPFESPGAESLIGPAQPVPGDLDNLLASLTNSVQRGDVDNPEIEALLAALSSPQRPGLI